MSEPLSLNVQARSVGNAVYLEHIGGCGDIAAWGEINFSTAEFVAEQINALLARFRAVIDMPAKMVFADGREPTTNERHLWNLLTWREADLAKQKEQTEYFKQQCDEAGTEIDRLKQQIEGHCERIVAASEVIARNAERSVWTRLEAWRNAGERRCVTIEAITGGWFCFLEQYGQSKDRNVTAYSTKPGRGTYSHNTVHVGTDEQPASLKACVAAALDRWQELHGDRQPGEGE